MVMGVYTLNSSLKIFINKGVIYMNSYDVAKIYISYNQNNHIIIDNKYRNNTNYDVYIFQSYNTIMMVIKDNDIYFNNDCYNYTNTTCKYLYKCLDDIKYLVSSENQKTIDDILSSKNKKQTILNYIIQNNKYIND